MKNLFQGGECNPNAIEGSNNAFKRGMQAMMMGNQNAEKMMEFTAQGVSFEEQVRNREIMFQQMNKAWAQEQQGMQMQGKQLDQVFMAQQAAHEQQMQMIQQIQWQKAQEHMAMHERAMISEFQAAQISEEAERWKNQAVMEDAYKQAEVNYAEEQERIHRASASMYDLMAQDSDPRFQNSKFLRFLKDLKEGQIAIQGKELIQKPVSEQSSMENAFKTAHTTMLGADKLMQANLEREKEKQQHIDKLMEEVYQKQQEGDPNAFEQVYEQEWQRKLMEYEEELKNASDYDKKMEDKYKKVLEEMNLDMNWMGEAWESAADLESQLVYSDVRNEYAFSPDNPFLDVALPLNLAMSFIELGRNNQAILALEAHLRKTPNDAESWRILGKILQENDQDQKCVPAFMNSLKHDPSNLDTLACLGISCTNVLDEVKAMNYLKHWMLNNSKFAVLKPNPNIISEDRVNEPTYRVEEIKEMNLRMIEMFEAATQVDPNDADLLASLAVLYFIKREYEVAVKLFQRASEIQPNNYTLWNKMGASLAHLGRADEAINCYHRALDLKPNYVRVWVNLGIAHSFKQLHEEAARFYLNALSFRPDAKHIWAYLQTEFMHLQRYDLIKLIARQDPSVFTEFDVMKAEELPMPEVDYKITAEQHLIGKEAERWVKELMK